MSRERWLSFYLDGGVIKTSPPQMTQIIADDFPFYLRVSALSADSISQASAFGLDESRWPGLWGGRGQCVVCLSNLSLSSMSR